MAALWCFFLAVLVVLSTGSTHMDESHPGEIHDGHHTHLILISKNAKEDAFRKSIWDRYEIEHQPIFQYLIADIRTEAGRQFALSKNVQNDDLPAVLLVKGGSRRTVMTANALLGYEEFKTAVHKAAVSIENDDIDDL
eukprot:TRINITY_DN5883_c0_g1_i4.p2 TRINITY_DN5883_c0_g1~~TRINITY_DN5883_c0_g1_i4.p2  ORF type:complete len:138 (+),score=22.88 TRINITY_DN5883_c0_g1_i4:53-466(+)